jgi:HNH endonuclease
MRVLLKKNIGEVLEVDKVLVAVAEKYKPHQKATPILEANLGYYCSYCEVWSSDLQVEHIISQHQDDTKKHDWDNFLLACATCNGAGNKGKDTVNIDEIAFPHLHNTHLIFEYLEGGLVKISDKVSDTEKQKNACLGRYRQISKESKIFQP